MSGPDPRFPDRPTHPDWHRLSEIALEQDRAVEQDAKRVADMVNVDEDSLMYLAKNRVQFTIDNFGSGSQIVMMALYLDAFAMGMKFAERGGHQQQVDL